jgi:SAM-dependent methyltransferase
MEQSAWRHYIECFHHERPGITSETLGRARDEGLGPYQWALEPLEGAEPLFDLACGDGPTLAHARSAGWLGLDASAAELARARAQGAHRLVRADVTRLPLRSGSTAALVCSMALMVVQPLDALLAEVRRVLTDDGRVVALLPGGRPLNAVDLYRYGQLMLSLRRTYLAYPNDRPLTRLRAAAARAGLVVADDRRRRFELALPTPADARRFVASLYLPGVEARRFDMAAARAAGWAPGSIGVPLRRVTLEVGRASF